MKDTEKKRLSRMTQEEIDACVKDAKFVGIIFDSTKKFNQIKTFFDGIFDCCEFTRITITQKDFTRCFFRCCWFEEVYFDRCEIVGSTFFSCGFVHCDFCWSKLHEVNFAKVYLEENEWVSTGLHSVAFSIDKATDAECDMIAAYMAYEAALVKVKRQYHDWYEGKKGGAK